MSSLQSLKAISDDIRKDISGGRLSTDSPYSERQVMEKIRQNRNIAIQDFWRKGRYKEFDQNWLQEYTPTYDRTIQDVTLPYTKYVCPRILKLDKGAGLFWAGKTDKYSKFRIYANMSELGNYNEHNLTKAINDKYNGVVYDNGYLYVFGTPQNRRLMVRAVFEEPQDITAFDAETTEYPVSGWMIPVIKDMVKKELGIAMQVPVDQINDGADSAKSIKK